MSARPWEPSPGASAAYKNLVKNDERKQHDWGDGWGWVMGLYERLRTGEWPVANRIKTDWFDAGTPTFAQRADAVQKLAGGRALLSRRGAWTEMGWSKARMDTEQGYFDEEDADPYLNAMAAKDAAVVPMVTDGAAAAAPIVG